jgi:ATP-dependent Zn protease
MPVYAQTDDSIDPLKGNRDLIDALRDALLDREELLGDEIMAVVEETLAARSARAGSSR